MYTQSPSRTRLHEAFWTVIHLEHERALSDIVSSGVCQKLSLKLMANLTEEALQNAVEECLQDMSEAQAAQERQDELKEEALPQLEDLPRHALAADEDLLAVAALPEVKKQTTSKILTCY